MKLELFIATTLTALAIYFYFNPIGVEINTPDFQAYEKRNLLEGIDVKPKE